MSLTRFLFIRLKLPESDPVSFHDCCFFPLIIHSLMRCNSLFCFQVVLFLSSLLISSVLSLLTQFWVFPAKWRSFALTSQSWRFWWRISTTSQSLGLVTQKCPMWLKSPYPCYATTSLAGGRGVLRISPSRKVKSVRPSPQSNLTSCWAASWRLWWTTSVSTKHPGWSGWQVSIQV